MFSSKVQIGSEVELYDSIYPRWTILSSTFNIRKGWTFEVGRNAGWAIIRRTGIPQSNIKKVFESA